jgi:hypothetical protein
MSPLRKTMQVGARFIAPFIIALQPSNSIELQYNTFDFGPSQLARGFRS